MLMEWCGDAMCMFAWLLVEPFLVLRQKRLGKASGSSFTYNLNQRRCLYLGTYIQVSCRFDSDRSINSQYIRELL